MDIEIALVLIGLCLIFAFLNYELGKIKGYKIGYDVGQVHACFRMAGKLTNLGFVPSDFYPVNESNKEVH